MERPNHGNVLPFEVWRECFILLGAAEHKNLAQTCRFFHDICLPFIFKSITYCSKLVVDWARCLGPSPLDNLNKHIQRFKEIATNPRRAALVRKCTLVYSLKLHPDADHYTAETSKDSYDPFVLAFVASLLSFVNLREVHINFDKRMDKRILVALTLLPNLEQVSFTCVKFGVHLLKPRIKLRKLVINNKTQDTNPNHSAKRLDIFSGERLEHVEILSRNYTPKLFRGLISQGNSPHLGFLSFQLRPQDTDVLYPFLATCPNLISIQWRIGFDYLENDAEELSLPPLPRSTIPHLRAFRGFAGAAKVFVPGRPVHKATISSAEEISGEELESLLQNLILSARPLTDLTLESGESTPEILDLIMTSLPQLRTLHLALPYEKVFKSKDPHHASLEAVAEGIRLSKADNPVIPDAQPVEYLVPIRTHLIYMNLLHWMAHRKMHLPPGLKTLHLDSMFTRYDGYSDEQIAKIGRPYTFPMAHSILEKLSIFYPELQCIVVLSNFKFQSKEELRWCKSSGGKWTYSGILQLCSSDD